MKAVLCTKYGSPDDLIIGEVEKPVPKEYEILIKIYAAVVSPTDGIMIKGSPFISRLFTGLHKPKNPKIGEMFSGEVEAVGNEVRRFKMGDQIFGSSGMDLGAYSEYICLPENAAIAMKPKNMNHDEVATFCDGAITALPFLRDYGKIRGGQSVLVYGASGSVGSFAVEIAKYYGAQVTGVCSAKNFEMVKSMGADKVIDYTKDDFTLSGETYDIVFDAVGKKSFSQCKQSLKPAGIFLSTIPGLSLLIRTLLFSKSAKKKGIFAATGLRSSEEKAKDLSFLTELIEAGKLKTVIDRRYRMEEIAEAIKYVEAGHKKGNVVINIGEK